MSNITEVIPIISAIFLGNNRPQIDRLIDKILTADYHYIN